MPGSDNAIAHLGDEQLEIQCPSIATADVLYVGFCLRMPETQVGHQARQLAAYEPLDSISLSPLDKALPGTGPHLWLGGRCEVEVGLLDQEPSAWPYRRRHPRHDLWHVLGDLVQQRAASDKVVRLRWQFTRAQVHLLHRHILCRD